MIRLTRNISLIWNFNEDLIGFVDQNIEILVIRTDSWNIIYLALCLVPFHSHSPDTNFFLWVLAFFIGKTNFISSSINGLLLLTPVDWSLVRVRATHKTVPDHWCLIVVLQIQYAVIRILKSFHGIWICGSSFNGDWNQYPGINSSIRPLLVCSQRRVSTTLRY